MILLAATIVLATLSGSSSAVEDSCVLIEGEFNDLNDGMKTAEVVPLRGFNYSVMGQDVTISTAINSINITGLTNFVPQDINVTSPNSAAIATSSSGQIAVDAELSAFVEEMDESATAHLHFVLE
ncbi:hypothetical protein GN958_ATG22282 [Phytophthora infestans]|uniref:Uncharacterized protein n=2 Tax=Phytophthora infestans TaxID=4787 RepID=A0A8S9TKL2_PHYIN|nr:hypothetical protein GN958_ATG22282 [Phytophthora infestans]